MLGQKTKKVSVSAAYIQNRVRWWLLLDDAGKTFEISVIGVLKPVAMRRGEIGRIVGLEWNMRLKPAESMAACTASEQVGFRDVAWRCGKHRHKLDTESMSRNRTWRSQQSVVTRNPCEARGSDMMLSRVRRVISASEGSLGQSLAALVEPDRRRLGPS